MQNILDKLLTHILGKFLIPFLHNMYQNKYPLIFIPVAQEPGSCKVKDHITHEYFLSLLQQGRIRIEILSCNHSYKTIFQRKHTHNEERSQCTKICTVT